MKEIAAKLKQNQRDIERLQEERRRLEQEKRMKTELKLGDIVERHGARRVILYDKTAGSLAAFNQRGQMVGWLSINEDYARTGKNIFTDNLLDLGY